MMTNAKRIALALFCAQSICLSACAGKDKIITMEELPVDAQTFVQTYFGKSNVSVVKKDTEILDTSYDVIMKDGSKMEFDRKGAWTGIKSRTKAIPNDIVPEKIGQYVKQNYPKDQIMSIEKDKNEYELQLSNHLELTFNKKGRLIDIDH